MTVLEKVQKVFNEVFGNSSIVLSRETTANDVDDWDSMTHIQFIVALEEEFGIKFALGELAELRHVGDALDLIEKKIK